MDIKHFSLTIKYDGTNYNGWQLQPDAPTVQHQIESALFRLTGIQTRIHSAGRTDTGVHALAQNANFTSETRLAPHDIKKGLNGLLPNDIQVTSATFCAPDFHSRYSALAKQYSYIIKQGELPSVMFRNFSHHIRSPLSINLMSEGTKFFLGTHNFKPFCANSGRENENYTREIIDIQIQKEADYIYIHVLGKSFLYKMVRYMAGTLIKIGYANHPPDIIEKIFTNPDKFSKFAGPVAPAKGLFLTKVFYNPPTHIIPFDNNCNLF